MSTYYTPDDSQESPPPILLTARDYAAVDIEITRELATLGPAPDLDAELKRELQAVGPKPTIQELQNQGHSENEWLLNALDLITSTGRVITLFLAEAIQSLAALIIAIVFAILEFWRVHNGALALGQPESQAALIAIAVVTANVIHPIYALRELRGQTNFTVHKPTLRGYLGDAWHRIAGQHTTETKDLYFNPTLHLAASTITVSTIILAVYDILGPLLTGIFTNTLTKPPAIAVMELIMGLGLSVAGVFFLQAATHEIGVRILTDQPARLSTLLEQRTAEHNAAVAAARETARQRFEKALADRQAAEAEIRRKAKQTVIDVKLNAQKKNQPIEIRPVENPARPPFAPPVPLVHTNGNGHSTNGNGHHPASKTGPVTGKP